MSVESFTPPQPLDTAVLFLVFNRLDTTKQVFEAIRQARPPRLYIAADGAREKKSGEAEKVIAVRDFILQNIDWDCDIKTLFREENLGCKYAVSGAIDWFFENEEMGIILEDDCLPNQSFFWFCEKMLKLYLEDQRIGMITGTNYDVDNRAEVGAEYFFSRHFTIWGWATWKRVWDNYDVDMTAWGSQVIESSDVAYLNSGNALMRHYKDTFDLISQHKMDTWDIQWVFYCMFSYRLNITPSVNLISNIGVEGTHATGERTKSHFIQTSDVDIGLIDVKKHVYPYMRYDLALNRENSRFNIIKLLKLFGLYGFAKKCKKYFDFMV